MLRTFAILLSALGALASAQASAQTQPWLKPDGLGALQWRDLGPRRNGRSWAVAGSDARPNEYYEGSAGGGLFKSVDAGVTWTDVSRGFFSGPVGAVAVDPVNPEIVYAGTGGNHLAEASLDGDGLYRSTDGGATWKRVAFAASKRVSRIQIDPRDPKVIYVGVLGNVYREGGERGVYKTTDGGETWRRVLDISPRAGVGDLVLDPHSPSTIFASFWPPARTPWSMRQYGPDAGLFRSTDGGATWTNLKAAPGLPQGDWGNAQIAVSPVKAGRVYLLLDSEKPGVYRSDDGGASWIMTFTDPDLRRNTNAFHRAFADPVNPDGLWLNKVWLRRSDDAGKSFDFRQVPHVDVADMWISPSNPQRFIIATDGGPAVTVTGGRTWSVAHHSTAQLYHLSTNNAFPYWVCASQQDNSTACAPNRADGGVAVSDWIAVGGEWPQTTFLPDNDDEVFALTGFGRGPSSVTRTDLKTGFRRRLSVTTGDAALDATLRFWRLAPILASTQQPGVLYVGANRLLRSDDRGETWKVISPDIAGADAARVSKPISESELYGTILSISESPISRGEIWTGSDAGAIHVTQDGGGAWRSVAPRDLPDLAQILGIEASRHAKGKAYVAASRYKLGDDSPYIFRTLDYGKTWRRITRGLPPAARAMVIREDPVRPGLLFAGTEVGVFFSLDDGDTWRALGDVPPVVVFDVKVHDADLLAVTHAVGLQVLHDISPLRQLTPEITRAKIHLFTPSPAVAAGFRNGGLGDVLPQSTSANPPNGAVIDYWLGAAPQGVILELLDDLGAVVRKVDTQDPVPPPFPGPASMQTEFRRLPHRPGLNRYVVRLEGGAGRKEVKPGDYTVRLTVGGAAVTRPLKVVEDPRRHGSEEDAEFELETESESEEVS